MTLLVLVLIITPFAYLAAKVVVEAHEFVIRTIPKIEAMVEAEHADETSQLAQLETWLEGKLQTEDVDLRAILPKVVEKIGMRPATAAVGVARDVLTGFVSMLATLFFLVLSLFYLYRDGPLMVHVTRELIPLKPSDRKLVLDEMRDAVNAAVRGGLVTAVIQGTLGGIILAILGVESPIFWAAVMALASLIPVAGTALVWAPIALFLFWSGEPWKAAILVGYGVVIIGSADNLLRPILVGQHMKAHSLLLFFGIIGSIMLFGFKGIVLGPIVVAALTATTTLFRREFTRAQDDAA